jgi:hypothetical protein
MWCVAAINLKQKRTHYMFFSIFIIFQYQLKHNLQLKHCVFVITTKQKKHINSCYVIYKKKTTI